jgi:hypothetical protein
MSVRIDLPPQLAAKLCKASLFNSMVAVFVNGNLLCPDHPDDGGDYSLHSTEIKLSGLRPDDLLTITDFQSFRWIFQDDKWYKF